MKIKAIISATTFTVLTMATVFIRIMQSAIMIDPTTGFYKPSYETFEPVFLILLFGFIAVYFLWAMLSKNYPKLENHFIKSKGLGVLTLIFAVVSAFRTLEYMLLNQGEQMTATQYILFVIFGAFTVFLLFFAVMLLRGYKTPAELFLIPSLFGAARFAVTFINYVDVIKVTDIILTLTMLGFTMMFWHMFARINAGLATKGTVKMMYGFGFPASLLCFACSVPKYYMSFFLPETSIHVSKHISYFDFAAGIYIAAFLIMASMATVHSYYDEPEETVEGDDLIEIQEV